MVCIYFNSYAIAQLTDSIAIQVTLQLLNLNDDLDVISPLTMLASQAIEASS